MPKQAREPLPWKARKYLEEVAAAVARFGDEGSEPRNAQEVQELWEVAFQAVRQASSEMILARLEEKPEARQVVEFLEVVAARLREHRDEANITQASLAKAMTELGFAWSRVTVAEVENGTRKVSLEELLALSALYGVPLVTFLLPAIYERLSYPRLGEVAHSVVRELILGPGAQVPEGGPEWEAALTLTLARSGQDDWRPAHSLWAARSALAALKKRGKR